MADYSCFRMRTATATMQSAPKVALFDEKDALVDRVQELVASQMHCLLVLQPETACLTEQDTRWLPV